MDAGSDANDALYTVKLVESVMKGGQLQYASASEGVVGLR